MRYESEVDRRWIAGLADLSDGSPDAVSVLDACPKLGSWLFVIADRLEPNEAEPLMIGLVLPVNASAHASLCTAKGVWMLRTPLASWLQ